MLTGFNSFLQLHCSSKANFLVLPDPGRHTRLSPGEKLTSWYYQTLPSRGGTPDSPLGKAHQTLPSRGDTPDSPLGKAHQTLPSRGETPNSPLGKAHQTFLGREPEICSCKSCKQESLYSLFHWWPGTQRKVNLLGATAFALKGFKDWKRSLLGRHMPCICACYWLPEDIQ